VRQRNGGLGLPVVEARQIRALVSPVRQDILDAVTAIGPCSVSELASALGRPADGLYYHIKALMRARLLTGIGGEAKGLHLDVVNRGFHLKYQPGSVANRRAVLRAVGAMVRSSERTFRRAYRPGTAVVGGARRNLWAGRARGALSQSELGEVNALLKRIVAIMRSGRHDRGAGSRRKRAFYELTFVLAPAFRSK
jgi:DNA-binding transcriptional ArsR family regulator